jgi:hypothetical protein
MKIHFLGESLRYAVHHLSPYKPVLSRVVRSVRLALHPKTLNFLSTVIPTGVALATNHGIQKVIT